MSCQQAMLINSFRDSYTCAHPGEHNLVWGNGSVGWPRWLWSQVEFSMMGAYASKPKSSAWCCPISAVSPPQILQEKWIPTTNRSDNLIDTTELLPEDTNYSIMRKIEKNKYKILRGVLVEFGCGHIIYHRSTIRQYPNTQAEFHPPHYQSTKNYN